MIAVGVRELKARLSEYLRRVRDGETVLVTDRGVVVAELGPPRRPAESRVPSRLEEMAAAGLVTLGSATIRTATPCSSRCFPKRSSGRSSTNSGRD